MNGYMGEYGEGFLGIGYSHPSATDPVNAETQPSTSSWSNSQNYPQPVFVAAQIYNGGNKSAEPHIPCEQQQQLVKDAGLARSKAQDILRNILSGIDADKMSTHPSQGNEEIGNFNAIKSTVNHNNDYYGPQEGFPSHRPSNTAEDTRVSTPPASSIESDAQAARIKALGILRKFQSQPDENGTADSTVANTNSCNTVQSMLQSSSTSNHRSQETNQATIDTYGVHRIPQEHSEFHPPQHFSSQSKPQSPIIPQVVPVTTPPWEFSRRRRECFAKEEERKQRALFKNLQYVARLEEERLAKQLVEVQQVKTLEQQIDERYQQKMEYRIQKRNNINNGSNNINTSGAGIGTKQRRKAEAKRQKTALPPSLRQKQHGNRGGKNGNGKSGSDSVAIYVSNIPTDGSIDEAMVQGLFSAYGSLRKVHFYVDKVTGKKKGDALVIYSLGKGEDEASFTESVCSQVNGCELPGGSVLRVEPSDPYHKVTAITSKSNSRSEKQQDMQSSASDREETSLNQKHTEDTGNQKQNGTTVGGGSEEEDLDDFFASLE